MSTALYHTTSVSLAVSQWTQTDIWHMAHFTQQIVFHETVLLWSVMNLLHYIPNFFYQNTPKTFPMSWMVWKHRSKTHKQEEFENTFTFRSVGISSTVGNKGYFSAIHRSNSSANKGRFYCGIVMSMFFSWIHWNSKTLCLQCSDRLCDTN